MPLLARKDFCRREVHDESWRILRISECDRVCPLPGDRRDALPYCHVNNTTTTRTLESKMDAASLIALRRDHRANV
jgi:hypothetical protein